MHNCRKKKKMKKPLSTFSFLQHYPKDIIIIKGFIVFLTGNTYFFLYLVPKKNIYIKLFEFFHAKLHVSFKPAKLFQRKTKMAILGIPVKRQNA